MATCMPPRGHRTAPTFHPSKPREIKRFFSELQYHFDTAEITDNTEKKNHAMRYVDCDIADIWESLPSFSDTSKTFNNFKTSVFELYPAADAEYKYTIADLDFLVTSRNRTDLNLLADLAEYHAQFLAITNFLISKHRLSEIEQKRAYVRGFPPALWSNIAQCLQIKLIDHLPDDPYPIADVYAAARFILHSSRSTSPTHLSTAPFPVPSSLDSVVKTEQLGTIFTEFTKSIIAAINSHQPRAASSTTPRKLECAFCGREHFIRNCDLVEEYRCAGKLKHNIDGKVILPTGAFIPRDIPGKFLQERIDEWHRLHPGQLAAASISYSTMINLVSTPHATPPTRIPPQTHAQSPAESRIAALEDEITRLRAKRPATTPPINARLPPFHTTASTNLTRNLSHAPRTVNLAHFSIDSSHAAVFSSAEFCSTQPRTFSVPDHNLSVSPRPFSTQFASRVVQKSTLSLNISRENCSALVHAPSTFHALNTTPNDEYFESGHAQTALSLSERSPAVVHAAEDKEQVLSPRARSPKLSEGYSRYLEHSATLPVYTLTTEPPFRWDTSHSGTNPSTSFNIAALPPESQEYVAPHPESPKTVQRRNTTANVPNSHSEYASAVLHSPGAQEYTTTSLTRHAALSTAHTLYLDDTVIPGTPTSILAPPSSSYAPPSSIQPPATLSTVALVPEVQGYVEPHIESSQTVKTCSKTVSISNSPSDHFLAVLPRSAAHEHITASLSQSVTPPTAHTSSINCHHSVDEPILILAPPSRLCTCPPIHLPPATLSVPNSNLDHPLVVALSSNTQEYISSPHTCSIAVSIAPASSTYCSISVDSLAAILAPLRYTDMSQSTRQPPEFTENSSRIKKTRNQPPTMPYCLNQVSNCSHSLDVLDASRTPDNPLFTAALFVSTSPPPPTLPPPQNLQYKITPRFHRRQSCCSTRSSRTLCLFSPRTSSFAAHRPSIDPQLRHMSRRLNFSIIGHYFNSIIHPVSV